MGFKILGNGVTYFFRGNAYARPAVAKRRTRRLSLTSARGPLVTRSVKRASERSDCASETEA